MAEDYDAFVPRRCLPVVEDADAHAEGRVFIPWTNVTHKPRYSMPCQGQGSA